MREILFRGKRVSNGEWVIGGIIKVFHPNYDCENEEEFLSQKPNCYCICAKNKDFFVEQASIGQYTGLTDKNGNKIFEGDIVKNNRKEISVVTYGRHNIGCCGCCYDSHDSVGFYLKDEFGHAESDEDVWTDVEIIGNIHDNPELLESEVTEE